MNLLEQYIKEIHSVDKYEADWTKEFDKKFVQVELTSESYGRTDRKKHVFDKAEWEKVKNQGYYWA